MGSEKKSSWFNHLVTFLVIFGIGGMLVARRGCGPQGSGPVPKEARLVDVVIGRHVVHAEVADTLELRRTGLMHRQTLAQGYGMLFVFDEPGMQSFWMKDTSIPLSIAFIRDDGRIVKIAKMHPNDLMSVPSEEPVKYALEVRQGWFEDRGIEPGAQVVLPAVLPPPPPPQMQDDARQDPTATPDGM